MNSKLWIRKALSMCLSVAVLATYSMVALAGPGKAAGELAVSGKNVNGETRLYLLTVRSHEADARYSLAARSQHLKAPTPLLV
jgi:hypothetical protein